MSAWIVVPCLLALRDEYNRISPGRDRGADGTIGDQAHASSSDHTPDEDSVSLRARDADGINEVHALDIDSTGPWPDPTWFDASILDLVERQRTGADDRLQYVIWNHRVASASWGWAWHAHLGPDPHTNHAHFSARYTSAQEADTRPWGVYEEDTVTKAEFLALLKDLDVRAALATAVLNTDGVVTAPGAPKPGKNPDGTDINTHWAAAGYLQQIYNQAVRGATNAAAIIPYVKAEALEVPPSAGENAAAVLQALAAQDEPLEQVAAALRAALGDRAADVGRLLAAA